MNSAMRRPALFRYIGLAVAIGLFAGMATHAAATKSGTFDEYVHVTAGFSYWTLDDYRLNPQNGTLTQRLIAVPLLVDHPPFPSLAQPAWQKADMWALSDQFFGASADPDNLLARPRMMTTI